MRDVYIVTAVRTAVGKAKKGTLRNVRPETLIGTVVKAAVERAAGLDPHTIDDVIVGCAMPEGPQGMNIGRIAVFAAGLPETVTGMTVNRFCSSGLQTIAIGAQAISAGVADVIVAGGVESMSSVPMGGFNLMPDPDLMKNMPQVYSSMGITAENLVDKYQISRQRQDEFSVASHQKAGVALADGRMKEQIVPLLVNNFDGKDPVVFDVDEGPRPGSTVEGLGALRASFKTGGSVTPGNSSQVSDGAAAVLLMSEDALKKSGLTPMARFVDFRVAGCGPEIMGIGPAYAIPKLFAATGKSDADIGFYELNEAFAAQSLAVLDQLKGVVDPAKVNPNGGAIAFGHPLGCTGAKLAVQSVYEMKRIGAKYSIVSMCIGGGMGAAGLLENL
ncbi:MAG TPA: thiolase family protein [Myxococcota bacterium]|nr:thiolase family protein [Myxococcota bacterium]